MNERCTMEKQKIYPKNIEEIGKKGIQMIKSGAIRNHKLGNNAQIHSGELEEKESLLFNDFLVTRNCEIVINLRGKENV